MEGPWISRRARAPPNLSSLFRSAITRYVSKRRFDNLLKKRAHFQKCPVPAQFLSFIRLHFETFKPEATYWDEVERCKSKGKGKLEQGEMYAKWSKRTRREVNSAAVAAGDDPDADRPIPNVKSNLQVKNELLTEDQMRKKEKERENNRLKNLPKAQRRAVEGAARKKKAQEAQSRAPKIMHKAARKKVKVIVR